MGETASDRRREPSLPPMVVRGACGFAGVEKDASCVARRERRGREEASTTSPDTVTGTDRRRVALHRPCVGGSTIESYQEHLRNGSPPAPCRWDHDWMLRASRRSQPSVTASTGTGPVGGDGSLETAAFSCQSLPPPTRGRWGGRLGKRMYPAYDPDGACLFTTSNAIRGFDVLKIQE